MRKFISIVLSILLLLSSSGIAYAKHYCGDFEMMATVTLGEKQLSCGMSMEVPDCDDEKETPDCCDNEYTSVETDETFNKANFEFSPDKTFFTAFAAVFVYTVEIIEDAEDPSYTDYDPPPLEQDLQILYETFLI